MKFIAAHTLAFLLALAAFSLYIVSFNTPFYSIAKKCKLTHRLLVFFFLPSCFFVLLLESVAYFPRRRLHQDC